MEHSSDLRHMEIGNLYQKIPAELPLEISDCLLQSKDMKIQRIVSRGHCSEPGFWYDQDQHEWVLLLKGEATLRFREDDRIVHLSEGMHLNIPAHVQHRVEWTTVAEDCMWLAVFY